MSRTIKKTKRESKGLPLTKVPKPNVLVKLKEEWIKPNEIKPTIYIGNTVNISKLMKFLEKSGVNAYQKQKLRKGESVTVQFGEGIRILQIISAESETGTFVHGVDGLEKLDPVETDAKYIQRSK